MGRLPEAWIAPPDLRELRELVRYRAKLVALRSGLKAQVHGVLAKEGITVPMSDLFTAAGMQLLADAPLAAVYRQHIRSLLELIEAYDDEVNRFAYLITTRLSGHRGYHAIQAIPGVGQVLAAVFVAEIGDVTRFSRASQLCCWAGLTPEHHESDTTVMRGHITKQGSRLVRWAALEAIQRQPFGTKLRTDRDRISDRRGKPIGKPPPLANC
jgi:transposase